jgi:hypothetical protein
MEARLLLEPVAIGRARPGAEALQHPAHPLLCGAHVHLELRARHITGTGHALAPLVHAVGEAPQRPAEDAGEHLRLVDELRLADEPRAQPRLQLRQGRAVDAEHLGQGHHRRLEAHVVVDVGVEGRPRVRLRVDVQARGHEEVRLDEVARLVVRPRGLVLELELELLPVVDIDPVLQERWKYGGLGHTRTLGHTSVTS